jgi:hypothetical protein
MKGQLFGKQCCSQRRKAKILYKLLLLKIGAKYCLDPEPEPEQKLEPELETELEPGLEPELFQSRNRNRNKSLRLHDTVFYHLHRFCDLRN